VTIMNLHSNKRKCLKDRNGDDQNGEVLTEWYVPHKIEKNITPLACNAESAN
jgi:hypothetical protein